MPVRAIGALILVSPSRASDLIAIGSVRFAETATPDDIALTLAAANPDPAPAFERVWRDGLRPSEFGIVKKRPGALIHLRLGPRT